MTRRETAPVDLSRLVERVWKAGGPDRELDAAIGVTIGGLTIDEHDPIRRWRDERGNTVALLGALPEYTSSFDAALALVEKVLPRHRVIITKQPDGTGAVTILSYEQSWAGYGATPPLAILLALLSAKGSNDV